jgi:biopolymer transport protein ExbD
MKLKRQRRFHAEVATASLNDIMFFLLLFFLIVSTLGVRNVIKLALPTASASQQVEKTKPITVSITKEKAYFIDATPVTPIQLEEKLASMIVGLPEPTVVLRADNSITIQDMIDVMATCAKLKIKIVVATKMDN